MPEEKRTYESDALPAIPMKLQPRPKRDEKAGAAEGAKPAQRPTAVSRDVVERLINLFKEH